MQPNLRPNSKSVIKTKKQPFPFLLPDITTPQATRQAQKNQGLDLFEKGLSQELRAEDTIDQTLQKIVKMALAAEFGASFVKSNGAKQMQKTIIRGIQQDRELRKTALLIADKYAKA